MASAEPPSFALEPGKHGRSVRLTWSREALEPAGVPGAEETPSPWSVEGEVEVSGEGIRRETTRMGFRIAGTLGSGLYEVLRPA